MNRKWWSRHADVERDKRRRRYTEDPDFREWVKQYNKAYSEQNRERIRAQQADYRKRNLEACLENARRWHRNNKDRVREYWRRNSHLARAKNARRRRRALATVRPYNGQDVLDQLRRQRRRCFWCKSRVGNAYHVDHVMPLARGGSNGRENIVVACPTCNTRKGAKLPSEFAGVLDL